MALRTGKSNRETQLRSVRQTGTIPAGYIQVAAGHAETIAAHSQSMARVITSESEYDDFHRRLFVQAAIGHQEINAAGQILWKPEPQFATG